MEFDAVKSWRSWVVFSMVQSGFYKVLSRILAVWCREVLFGTGWAKCLTAMFGYGTVEYGTVPQG